MGDIVFNVAKGKVNEYLARVDGNDPANSAIIVLLLKVSEADGTLQDYDTLGALLGGANTEADFTNYARKTLTDANITAPSPDDTNNRQDGAIGNLTWTAAGGASNNTLVKMLVCYDSDTTGGTDANIIPLTAHDFAITTNGSDLSATEPAGGFFRAS